MVLLRVPLLRYHRSVHTVQFPIRSNAFVPPPLYSCFYFTHFIGWIPRVRLHAHFLHFGLLCAARRVPGSHARSVRSPPPSLILLPFPLCTYAHAAGLPFGLLLFCVTTTPTRHHLPTCHHVVPRWVRAPSYTHAFRGLRTYLRTCWFWYPLPSGLRKTTRRSGSILTRTHQFCFQFLWILPSVRFCFQHFAHC